MSDDDGDDDDGDNDDFDNGDNDNDYDFGVTISNALWKLCKVQLVPQQGHHHFFHQGAELF